MTRKEWEDNIMKGIDYSHKLLELLRAERGQLYGAIIHLMLTNNLDSIELPEIETFRSYGKDYYILFSEKEGKFMASLLPQDKENKDGDNS
jgi:hypothetical protein